MLRKVCMIIVLLTMASAAQMARDRPPLNVKLGLWENTFTVVSTVPTIPPEDRAKMSPAEQAKVQAMLDAMNAKRQGTKVMNLCLRAGMQTQAFGVMDQMPNCTFDFAIATPTKQEIHMECHNGAMTSKGIFLRNVIDMGHVEGSDQMNATDGTHTTVSNRTMSSKWIAADCGALATPR